MSQIKTSFLVGDVPHPEYPRPQFQRESWQNLNGLWNYAITKSDCTPTQFDGQILVPFCIESELSGVNKTVEPDQFLWYQRNFEIDGYKADHTKLLQFGAVDYECEVWINRQYVGAHTGGYCPFTLNITPYLIDGENEIIVRVSDPTDTASFPRGKQVLKPQTFWYTAVTGIWQTVWLEQIPTEHVEHIKYVPSLTGVDITVQLSTEMDAIVNVFDNGKIIKSVQCHHQETVHIEIDDPKHWTPENPYLYQVEIKANADSVKSYFALRTCSIAEDEKGVMRILLNGKPYFQKGLLDQGYWPDGLYTPASDEALRYDIEKMKSLGFNVLRKHLKVELARWYYHCDTLGMLVWQDMPNGAPYAGSLLNVYLPYINVHVSDTNYNRFKRNDESGRTAYIHELEEMITTLYNVPSIVMWVPFNEGWGQFDSVKMNDLVKKMDSTRLVDHASGWHDQGVGDIASVHKYIFKVTKPKSCKGRAFAVTEYGGYSSCVKGHEWDEKGSFGYKMFEDKESLSKAYLELHEKQIFPLMNKGLCATIYTQLSDVEIEVNGILTYDRKICKIDEEIIKEVNSKLV